MPPPLTWDLSVLLPSLKPSDVEPAFKGLEARVAEIERERPRLDGLSDPADVERLFDLLGGLSEETSRVLSRGSLAFAADTRDERAAAFLARAENLSAGNENRVLFVDLWWKRLPEARAEALMPRTPDLAHYARRLRAYAPYTLSEPEERVLTLKNVTGESALETAREMLTARLTFRSPLTRKDVTVSELVRGVYHPTAGVRKATYDALWRVWAREAPLLGHVYRTVVQDWANEEVKLRRHPSAIHARNLGNDVPDEAVATLLEVVRSERRLFQRYFVWKGRRLKLRRMSRYHLYAPLRRSAAPKVPYAEAVRTVLGTLDAFDERIGGLARRVFDGRHVDVLPRPGKQSGAFCATAMTRMTPFLFLNHTDDAHSLRTLAHEMGHGIHSMLAADRHPLVSHAGLPMAETASVFGEMLLHDHLVREDRGNRATLIAEKVDEIYATVLRQAYFARFELAAHEAVLGGATTDDLHTLYLAGLREQFGPVQVPDAFRLEWTYIPHMFATPFYVYAYSFGMLLSLALYDMFREEGRAFVPRYRAILSAGGARSPEELLRAEAGVDIRDAAFWRRGFRVVERMVREVEKAS